MTDIATSMAQEQIKELRAENERLRRLHRIAIDGRDEIERGLREDNERLREEVTILRTTETAEIERLRAALQWIADYDGPRSLSVEEAARRALEPKP